MRSPRSRPRARPLVVAATVLAVLVTPGGGLANGDPASHVLLAADVFFPQGTPTSPEASQELMSVVAATRTGGRPYKVAVIDKPSDLGTVAHLFDEPQEYAELLGREIGIGSDPTRLLVVMHAGFGVYAGAESTEDERRALDGIEIGPGADGLVQAASDGIGRLTSGEGVDGGGTSLAVVLVAVGGVGLLGLAAVAIALGPIAKRRRGAGPTEPHRRLSDAISGADSES